MALDDGATAVYVELVPAERTAVRLEKNALVCARPCPSRAYPGAYLAAKKPYFQAGSNPAGGKSAESARTFGSAQV